MMLAPQATSHKPQATNIVSRFKKRAVGQALFPIFPLFLLACASPRRKSVLPPNVSTGGGFKIESVMGPMVSTVTMRSSDGKYVSPPYYPPQWGVQ